MELYSSFLKLAPLLLLKLMSARGYAGARPRSQRWARAGFVADAAVIAVVVVGCVIALFVLGDVIETTPSGRLFLILAGSMSLLTLGVFEVGQIAAMYQRRPRDRTPSNGASQSGGEAR